MLVADAMAFAFFYLLPQIESVQSNVVYSTLELDGYGALLAMSHPLSIAMTTVVRFTYVGLLFFGQAYGRYVLLLSVLLTIISAAIGGLAVFTALDHLALTILYLLDGVLLARTLLIGPTVSTHASTK